MFRQAIAAAPSAGNACASLRRALVTKRRPPRLAANAPGRSGRLAESRRQDDEGADQEAARHDDGQRGDGAIERAASRRIDGEGALLVAVPQLARLLRDQRPLPDHPLDEIVRERQTIRRPGPERALHAHRERGAEEAPGGGERQLPDRRHPEREDAEAGHELEDAPRPR